MLYPQMVLSYSTRANFCLFAVSTISRLSETYDAIDKRIVASSREIFIFYTNPQLPNFYLPLKIFYYFGYKYFLIFWNSLLPTHNSLPPYAGLGDFLLPDTLFTKFPGQNEKFCTIRTIFWQGLLLAKRRWNCNKLRALRDYQTKKVLLRSKVVEITTKFSVHFQLNQHQSLKWKFGLSDTVDGILKTWENKVENEIYRYLG